MKPSLDAPESSADASPAVSDRAAPAEELGSWWRSRKARWLLVAAVLLAALGITVEPFVSRQVQVIVANLYAGWAWAAFDSGDLTEALANCDSAIQWAGDDPLLYLLRGNLHLDNNDLAKSLADYNRVIELRPTFAGGYSGRARVYQRQRRYAEAIADVTIAIRQRPAWEPEPWNHRAYVRALAGVELEQALDDVDKAIRLSPGDNAAYLDTRGLVRHKLGRNQEALADLDRSIQLTIAQQDQWRRQLGKEPGDPRRNKRAFQEFDHSLAAMYEHRSQVQQALGNEEQARQDADKALQLGFDPDRGIE